MTLPTNQDKPVPNRQPLQEQLRKLHELNSLMEAASIAQTEELVICYRNTTGGLEALLHNDEGGLDSLVSEAVESYIEKRQQQVVILLDTLGIVVDSSLLPDVTPD